MSLNWNLHNKQNKYNLDKQIEQINILTNNSLIIIW